MIARRIRCLAGLPFPKEPTSLPSGFRHLWVMGAAVAGQRLHKIRGCALELLACYHRCVQAKAARPPLCVDLKSPAIICLALDGRFRIGQAGRDGSTHRLAGWIGYARSGLAHGHDA